jgi:hypothetical protein
MSGEIIAFQIEGLKTVQLGDVWEGASKLIMLDITITDTSAM